MFDAMDKREKEEAKTGKSAFYGEYGKAVHGGRSVNDSVKQAALSTAINTQAMQSAQRMANLEVSSQLEASLDLREQAAGIDTQFGKTRALANAVSVRMNDRSEGLKHIEALIDVNNPSTQHLHALAVGNGVAEFGLTGDALTREVREVAVKKIAGGANVQGIIDLSKEIELGPGSDEFLRTAFVDSLKVNGAKPSMFGANWLNMAGIGLVS